MAKPGGSRCNLDCSYCFYLEKERLVPSATMSDEVLEAYTVQRLQAEPGSQVEFTWQGGEPTLVGLDFFRRAVALQQLHGAHLRISNSLQTNGLLLNSEWGEFLSENRFLVGISIDGPEDLHDAYRLDRGGRPSFRRVMAGLEVLQKHEVEFNTLTVVHRQNSRQPERVYEFLKDIGSRFWQFIPLVERFHPQPDVQGLERFVGEGPGELSQRSVEPRDWGDFLWSLFRMWVTRDVGQIFVQLFEVALQSYLGMPPSLCLFRETCGDAVALEQNGDLFSCDHYVFPEHRLGNILRRPLSQLMRLPQQRHFGQQKQATLPAYCRNCEVLRACQGECPKNRFVLTPDGEPGLNYLCQGYKHFFTSIQPYVGYMAECLRTRRSVSEVMTFARTRLA